MIGFVVVVLAIFFLAQVVSVMIFGFYAGISYELSGMELRQEQYLDLLADNMIYISIMSGVLSLAFFWFFSFIKNAFQNRIQSLWNYCRLQRISGGVVIFSLLAGMGFYFLLSGIMFFTQLPQYFPEHQELLEPMFHQHVLVSVLGLGVMASLVEEIGFRGLIFNRMRQELPVAVALIIQAVIFGAIHMNVLQSSYAFILGILLGLIFIWTSSLWAPILLHLSFNSSSALMVQVFKLEENAANMGGMIVVGVILLFISICYLYVKRPDGCGNANGMVASLHQ